MVGMHARAGTPDGVLCHTISTTTWRNLYFNETCVGEFGINAALCGHYDCPVVLITGDEATVREGRELLGDPGGDLDLAAALAQLDRALGVLEDLALAFRDGDRVTINPGLDGIAPFVPDSGEGHGREFGSGPRVPPKCHQNHCDSWCLRTQINARRSRQCKAHHRR